MSLRLLLAVVIAGALVAASMPAIQAAQQTQAEHQLSTTVDELDAATSALLRHSDPVQPGVPGATRQVSVSVPQKPANTRLTIGPADDPESTDRTLVRTTVPGNPSETTLLDVHIRPGGPDGTVRWNDSLTISETTDLTLRYRRVNGTPVITVTRGFK